MLDADLAQLYGVATANLNKAVKRNIDRFPAEFVFRLTVEEKFQSGISKGPGEEGADICRMFLLSRASPCYRVFLKAGAQSTSNPGRCQCDSPAHGATRAEEKKDPVSCQSIGSGI